MEPTRQDHVLWPDPEEGPWCVDVYWGMVEGRSECVGLRLRSFTTGGESDPMAGLQEVDGLPLRATDLRNLPLRRILEELRKGWRQAFDHLDSLEAELAAREGREPSPVFKEAVSAEAPARGGRPPLYGPVHFERVARVYLDAYANGTYPTKAVADNWGVERTTAAKWVAKCRERGLLGPTQKRRAGGVNPSTKEGE